MRIAINGFGRIGRSVFRILENHHGIEVVAINDLFDNEALRYLLAYDTVMGPFGKALKLEGDHFVTDKGRVRLLAESDPASLPWSELGIDTEIQQQEWAQFLESIGPPPGRQIDAFRLGWIADFVDAMNFLELWTCESGNNSTNFCDPEYDRLVEQARNTPDDAERWDLYGQMEEIMFGPDGAVPTIPIYWYTYVQLERPSIKDSLNVNLLSQTDYSKVVEVEPSA